MNGRELQLRYNEWHQQRLQSAADSPETSGQQLRFYDWILSLVSAEPGSSLLDVASGQGHFLAFALSRGLDVSGIDLSDVAVEEAKQRLPEADIRVGAAESLPFDDDCFDIVVCLGSLEHFPDPVAGASEMRRVLREGGSAVIFVPNLFFLGHIWFGLRYGTQPTEGNQAFSETFRSSQGWIDLLTQAGLVVREHHPWNQIYASQRVAPVVQSLWNVISRAVPRNGAYAFAFVCSKS